MIEPQNNEMHDEPGARHPHGELMEVASMALPSDLLSELEDMPRQLERALRLVPRDRLCCAATISSTWLGFSGC